jgi:hypothetical protein
MSTVSNHHPEVIDELNAERPEAWDQVPSEEELDLMARYYGEDSPLEVPAGPTAHTAAAADEQFMILWGFADGLQRDLSRTSDLHHIKSHLAPMLRRKLDSSLQEYEAASRQRRSA